MITFLIILILIDVIGITLMTSHDNASAFGPIALLIASFICYHFFIHPITYSAILLFTQTFAAEILGFIGGWVIIGAIWSIFKWYNYLKRSRRKQDEIYAKQVKNIVPGRPIPTIVYSIPKAADMKQTIIAWMIYWPFSMLGHLVFDSLKELYNSIYDYLSKFYDKMAEKAFK